jgi:hypothetical protein
MSNPRPVTKVHTLDDFHPPGEALGHGNFCSIHPARLRESDQQYAMKVMNKRNVEKLYKEKDVLMEKHALSRYVFTTPNPIHIPDR